MKNSQRFESFGVFFFFYYEEQVVNLIISIQNQRLAFAHYEKSFLKHEDLYAIIERNYGKQIGIMKAFDILLKLDKTVGKLI